MLQLSKYPEPRIEGITLAGRNSTNQRGETGLEKLLIEENSLVCLKIMYLPFLVIAHFKSELAKSTEKVHPPTWVKNNKSFHSTQIR